MNHWEGFRSLIEDDRQNSSYRCSAGSVTAMGNDAIAPRAFVVEVSPQGAIRLEGVLDPSEARAILAALPKTGSNDFLVLWVACVLVLGAGIISYAIAVLVTTPAPTPAPVPAPTTAIGGFYVI